MFEILKYKFAAYNFCFVDAAPDEKSVTVHCKSRIGNPHLPESFRSLVRCCRMLCDHCEVEDDGHHFTHTYHFDDTTLVVVWRAGSAADWFGGPMGTGPEYLDPNYCGP